MPNSEIASIPITLEDMSVIDPEGSLYSMGMLHFRKKVSWISSANPSVVKPPLDTSVYERSMSVVKRSLLLRLLKLKTSVLSSIMFTVIGTTLRLHCLSRYRMSLIVSTVSAVEVGGGNLTLKRQ